MTGLCSQANTDLCVFAVTCYYERLQVWRGYWARIRLMKVCGQAFSRTCLHGQANLEAGVTGPGLEAYISFVVAGDYAAGDVQTKTGALSDILGCEKGFENVRLHHFGNAWAVVGDLHEQPAWLLRGSYPDASRSINRVDGVVYQVRPHLVELVAVRAYGGQAFIVLTDHDDFGTFQLVREHGQRVLKSIVHVDLL